MLDINEISEAIRSHSIWKVRLQDAVDTGKSEFTPDQVRANHLCEFGKWLASRRPAEKSLEDYGKIQAFHERFHIEAANVLQMSIEGQREKAHAALTDIDSEFVYTSAQLINALIAWKRKLS